MIVKVNYEKDSFDLSIITNLGKVSVSFWEGSPEDMIFGRDLNDIYKIETLVDLAYKAGLAGEPITYIIDNEFEEDDNSRPIE